MRVRTARDSPPHLIAERQSACSLNDCRPTCGADFGGSKKGLAQAHRHEDPRVAALNQQRHLILVTVHELRS